MSEAGLWEVLGKLRGVVGVRDATLAACCATAALLVGCASSDDRATPLGQQDLFPGVEGKDASADDAATEDGADPYGAVLEHCQGDGNVLYLAGQPQDYIHPGVLTLTDAAFSASHYTWQEDVRFFVNTEDHAEWWILDFHSRNLNQILETGVYDDAQRAAFADPPHPGLDVTGDGRGCNTLSGSFEVHEIDWRSAELQTFLATFVQYCEEGSAALHGCLRYTRPGYDGTSTRPEGWP